MEDKVLELAKKGGFDNVDKLNKKWKGKDVYIPVGENGETLYIGNVYFLVEENTVRPANRKEAEEISDYFSEESDYCD